MELFLPREKPNDVCTHGQLFVNSEKFCETLEDVVREISGVPVEKWKIDGKTAIPAGRYYLSYDYSPHFGRNMLHVNLVPGFNGIRIHSVGTAADTEGCIGVGDQRTENGISGGIRHQVLEKLEARVVPALKAGELCWLTVKNAEPV